MKYNLRQLRYFVATADFGSISDAAKSLNISQPSVSAAISHIEKQYGVALFLRRKSLGVTLTSSGAILLREARMLLNHAADFDAIATNVANEVSGEIRIASFVNVAPVYMAGIIRTFHDKYPNVSVATYIGNQQEVLESVREGRSELAITFDIGLSNEYTIDSVYELPPQVVVAHDHRIAHNDEVSLSNVISEPFIFLDLPYSRDYFFSIFERQGLRPEQTIPLGSFETIRTYVGNGLGYSLLNLMPRNATNYDGTKVKYVPLTGSHRSLRLCCVSLQRSIHRRATVAFISHVKQFFRLPH